MVTLSLLFWVFVVLFAIIGAMRGWAQEMLVAFTVILALFIITVLGLVPFVRDIVNTGFVNANGEPIRIDTLTFWIRTALLTFFVFFGYQTPRIRNERIRKATSRSERLQDTLLGIIVGGFNGYLIFGTLWFFLIQADYFLALISPPPGDDALAARIIAVLPPMLLRGNTIFFAIAIAFAFVVIVFI